MNKCKAFLKNIVRPSSFSSGSKDGTDAELERIANQEQKIFAFETLVAATKKFHSSQKLGQGAFGPVFKGTLKDGREIAVKKLSLTSTQGTKEFKNEAKLLTRVQHKNVVNLLGYCIHGAEKLLVYEYVVNESLDKHLFKADKRESFDWKQRYDVIIGVAKGLLYLHEQAHRHIIHRDIKASNILLDDKWVPKIADFGMAYLFPEDQTHINTHIAGTNGYLAPEYLMRSILSVKADVFSFGVVVLELVTGEKNSSFSRDLNSNSLLDWVFRLYKNKKTLEVMDPVLASSADIEQVALCIHLGLLCVQSDPRIRPDMSRVITILSRKHATLEEPMKPGYSSSRYRRGRRSTASFTGSGISGASTSQSSGSKGSSQTGTFTSVTDHSINGLGSSGPRRSDPHGKRPIQ